MEYLDFEKPIEELMSQLNKAKELGGEGVDVKQAISDLEEKIKTKRKHIYSNLSPWQKVQLSRHPQRPYTLDYIEHMSSQFIELHGDRNVKDDKAMIGGWAKIDGKTFMVIGQLGKRSPAMNVF